MRGLESNQLSPGYEPGKLPALSTHATILAHLVAGTSYRLFKMFDEFHALDLILWDM